MSTKQFTAKIFRWLHQVNADADLPLSAMKVAVRLCGDFNEEQGGMAWPSCSTIAAAIGLSKGTVINVIRALQARGHLRIEWGKQGRGHSNQYWMIEKDSDQGDLFEREKGQPVDLSGEEKRSTSEARKGQSTTRKGQSTNRKGQPVGQPMASANHSCGQNRLHDRSSIVGSGLCRGRRQNRAGDARLAERRGG
jgi:hypothetical protein